MKMRYTVATALALVFAVNSSPAQDVTIKSSSQLKLAGALGTMMRMLGNSGNTQETTWISGSKLRRDTGDNGVIIDLDAGRIVSLAHKERSYTTMTFAEVAEMMNRAAAQMQQSMAQSRGEIEKAQQEAQKEGAELQLEYKVAVEPTNETRQVAGVPTKRALMTLTVEARAKAEGEPQQSGSFVILTDMWRTTDATARRLVDDFYKAYAEKAGQEFARGSAGFQALFSQDPRMGKAMEAAAKEMRKLEGVSLHTTTHVVVVPQGQAFDRAAALGGAQEQRQSGGGGMFGRLREAARQAGQADQQQKNAEAKQSTLMTVVEETREISGGPVAADRFTIPSGYREKKLEMPR